MNRTKLCVVLGLLFLVFAIPVLALERNSTGSVQTAFGRAEGHHDRSGQGPGGRLYALASRLDLTQEQLEKLQDLRSRQISETAPLRNELLEKRLEIRKMFTDVAKDDATILSKQREIQVVQQKLHEKMTQFRLEQRRVLTPQQLKELNEMSSQRP